MRLARLIASVLLATAVLSCGAQKPKLQVALTFDDLPETGAAPPEVTRLKIIDQILDTLKAEKIPPVYGFLIGSNLDGTPEAASILRNWTASGNMLGSHTYSHPDLEKMSVSDFEANIRENEPALQHYAGQSDWHYFRYPYLHEGETLEKRQAVQTYLKEHSYKVAEVSIDFEDYLWNGPYTRCLAQGRTDKVNALHDSYLAAVDEYSDIFRSLAQRLYGGDIPYVLLLHVSAFNAKVLPDLIERLRERGFTFITLPEALANPAYAVDPAIGYPSGGAMQELLAASRKLPMPPAVKPTAWLENTCK